MFLSRFGGSLKLELTGDRLGAILGGVVRDDTTELVVASIYSISERWPVNLAKTCGGWSRESSLAQGIRGIYRGSHSGDHGGSQWLMAMRWRYSGTWHKARRRQSPACLSGSTATSSALWPEYFIGRSYPRR
jgi:hypothetical protein